MMDFIKNKVLGLLVGDWLKAIWKFLDGKKTVLGSIQLLLFVLIWVLPPLFPEFKLVGEYARKIVEFINSQGIDMDIVLVEASGLTLLGLYHKMVKILKGDKE